MGPSDCMIATNRKSMLITGDRNEKAYLSMFVGMIINSWDEKKMFTVILSAPSLGQEHLKFAKICNCLLSSTC